LFVPSSRRQIASQLRITPGAMVVAGLNLAVSLVWLLCDEGTRAQIAEYVVASPSTVFEHGRVWTIVTTALLEPRMISLIINLFVLWAFVPTLERFWGTPRFYRFVVITSIAGVIAGLLAGLALGRDVPIVGLSPFTLAAIVAFGVIYARQPVQFFGVLPLTGRQLMFGFLAVQGLATVLGGQWEMGAAFAGASIAAAVITSKRWSPSLAWKRWRIARARRRLSVIEGGAKPPRAPKKRDEGFLN
jgi:membrane associated rhomboid family serine protease